MSMKEPSKTSDSFDALAKKGRALLTKQERHVIALKQAADQADLELRNASVAAAAMAKRVDLLREAAVKAAAAFQQAKAGLEKTK